MKIDIYYHLYGRKDDIVFEEVPDPFKWIPVSERLPDEEPKGYWVCTDNGNQYECRWTNANVFWTGLTTDWHWNIFDIPPHSKVVAWMPLPPAYVEEGGHDG